MFRSFLASTCVAALLLTTTAASAQTPTARPERPSRALFGSQLSDDVSQLLTVAANVGAGVDSNVVAGINGERGVQPSALFGDNRGPVATGAVGLGYSLQRDPVRVNAELGSAARYYPSVSSEPLRRERATVGATVNLPLDLVANASAAYLPYSTAGMFPAASGFNEVTLPDDIGESQTNYVSWRGALSTARQLSRRLQVNAEGSYGTRRVSRGIEPFETAGGGGGLRYNIGRGLDLKAGYRYASAQYRRAGRPVANHLIDAGADYNRSLSFSRRTTLTFSSGTSAVTRPESTARTRFRLNGNVALTHEIGRSWTASLAYRRGVYFVESWPEPVLSDGLSATVGGLFTRRVRFTFAARASTGRIGLDDDTNGFTMYYGTATLSYAVTRYLSADLKYASYQHRFDRLALAAPGFGPWLERHRVIAQISVWAPLFQRARREDVTR